MICIPVWKKEEKKQENQSILPVQDTIYYFFRQIGICIIPGVRKRAFRSIFLDVHAKETHIHSINLLKCKKCFGSVGKAFAHLSWVNKPAEKLCDSKLAPFNSGTWKTIIVSMKTKSNQFISEYILTESNAEFIFIFRDVTWISSQVWPPRSYQSWRPPAQTPLRPQGDSVFSSTCSLGPRCTIPASWSVTLIRKTQGYFTLQQTVTKANRKTLQEHSLLAENLFSFLVFPDFFRQLSQMKLL